jgi:hypothetical protein
MNAMRTWLSSSLAIVALGIAGCQHPLPPPLDSGPAPDPEVMNGKIDQMKMVGSGTGHQLVYKTTQPGELYVFDAATGKYVYDAPLAAGEQFVFEPASSRATINKQPVDLIRGSNDKDEYRMYFVPQ